MPTIYGLISILRVVLSLRVLPTCKFCNECSKDSVNFVDVSSSLLCLRGKLDSLLHDVTTCAANNLSYVCLGGETPTLSSPVDDDTKFVLDWVRGGVPVGIIQLFLPSDSEGAAGPCLLENLDKDIDGMCEFVKAFAEGYASNPKNDWSSCSKDDYVCNAIYRAATSNNTQNFSCSLWQQKSIRKSISEKMSLNDKVELTDKLKTSRHQGLFLGMVGSNDCSKKCSDKWRPVCSVSALLLDFLPKVPPNCPKTTNMPRNCPELIPSMPRNCPETSNTESQTCQVFKNGTIIDIELPTKLVTKEVTVSVSQLLDEGNVKKVSTMSIMEKMMNVSTSTANVSMSGSVVTIQKNGTYVSASINSSTIKVFTSKTNVTMSTKGLNLTVLTDTLPMAFSINKANVTINKTLSSKATTNVNWTCNISQQGKEFTCCVYIVRQTFEKFIAKSHYHTDIPYQHTSLIVTTRINISNKHIPSL